MAYDPARYTHDSDRTALAALKAIPGFSAITRGFMNIWNEPQQRIMNMSSRIRLSEKQMAKYYEMLPPICEKLGIAVPELYLELDVTPNARTYGDNNPFIVISSGLLETIPDDLVPTVLAHECGHIACHHTLYLTMGRMILSGASSVISYFLRFGGLLSASLKVAFYYWMRCSEFSADRAAVLCDGTASKTQEVCMRLAGWDKDIHADADMNAFLQQAAEYKELINGKAWNKALEFMILSQATHPLMAVRATECAEWADSDEFSRIINGLPPEENSPGEKTENKTASLDFSDMFRPSKVGGTIPEDMQLCKVGNETLLLPRSYHKVKSLPEDPAGSLSYGYKTAETQALLMVYPENTNQTIPFDDPQSIIDEIHHSMANDQGIIEVNAGVASSGRRYICSIVKTFMKEKGVQYYLLMNLEGQDSVITVRAFFDEAGNIGCRESEVFELLRKEGLIVLTDEGADGWNSDPYDPAYKKGILMNRSEDAEFDNAFPHHPLTEARKTARMIIQNN